MIPLASTAARALGKRIGKVTTQQMNEAGALNTYLIEVFKNQSILKICISGLKTMFNPEDVFVFICSKEQ